MEINFPFLVCEYGKCTSILREHIVKVCLGKHSDQTEQHMESAYVGHEAERINEETNCAAETED
jgi:hypothetical protein